VLVNADVNLWVDGLRIYKATAMGMRIVSDRAGAVAGCTEVLDPEVDTWLNDHAPTYTLPALPMMSMVDRLAQGAMARKPALKVIGLENITVHRWLGFPDGARHLRVSGTPKGKNKVRCQLLMWDTEASRYVIIASGDVVMGEHHALSGRPMAPVEGAEPVADPYASGDLFHGPAFQVLRSLSVGTSGSSSILDAGGGAVPFGVLNQLLLDGATHGIPHDNLQRWCEEIAEGTVAYPKSISRAVFYGPAPG
jgi:hypothetical protein